MKRYLALLVALVMACPVSLALIPDANKVVNSVTYQVPEEEIEQNLQAQVDEYISRLVSTKSDRDYTYHSETVETKYVSGSGYAGNQPANGVRFTTGGSFFWAETGGPTLDASVTFSDPLQIVSVTIDLGVKSNSSTGYIVNVPSTDAFYKLHVYKVMRVDKYVTYQTSLITGETREYMTLYPKTMDSYTLSAVQD